MAVDFSNYDAVLLDLDGTLYFEDHVVPGAPQLVARLAREGRKYACLSNSTLTAERIARRLEQLGMRIDPEHIYSAAVATADYVMERHPAPRRVFNLANESIHELLDGRVRWVASADEPCDVVIAGVPTSDYATEDRQRAAMLMLRAGAELVGICADRIFPSPRGLEFGVGALCAMLGYAANVTPVFCGKPQDVFFHELCRRLEVRPERCVLIGDNLESDIAGARRVGMHAILTLTGVTSLADVERLPRSARPDVIVRGLAELAG